MLGAPSLDIQVDVVCEMRMLNGRIFGSSMRIVVEWIMQSKNESKGKD